ncbi:hypothetical protein FOZ62_000640 [Perkinsus olseni]|uniref:Uncharacterized protein n=2 Tax=Perkinsus olseni TaxID=32597 RepID=A0A7J6R1J1_PEROL|nr:hypothetical protein FOZ62_000640 [Perkinsus olseni]
MFSRLCTLAIITAPCVSAWGVDGHSTVAEVGDNRLSVNARQAVNAIMGDGVRLGEFSSWPDFILHGTPEEKEEWGWSAGLHYADSQDCTFEYDRDCKDDWCVAGAIKNYTRRVADESLSRYERQVAMKFLVHFMGDIHQPLHAGSSSNLGGNLIKVTTDFANNKSTNLHSVWDFSLLDQWELERYAGQYVFQDDPADHPGEDDEIQRIDRTRFWTNIVDSIGVDLMVGGKYAEKVDGWLRDCETRGIDECVNTMLEDDVHLACSMAYTNVDGTPVKSGDVLSFDYYTTRIETVREQLAKGGVRFAWLLNNIFEDGTTVIDDTTTTPAPATTTAPTTTPSMSCEEADKVCAKSFEGSYCKYWLDQPVCSGSDEPCSCSAQSTAAADF